MLIAEAVELTAAMSNLPTKSEISKFIVRM